MPKPHKQRSLGSGFVISPDGYIVTNNHVVDGADEVKVQFRNNEKPIKAKIIGRDKETDLALLKIDGKSDLPYLEFGDSSNLKVGAWVLAIGNPFGLENTVTLGIVSAKGRVIGAGPFDNFIQTDASINPGNSGGPLIDLDGKVIGINTAIVASGQGIGFAIPASMAKDVIAQLRQGKSVQRGWLGVTIQDIDENTAKALGMDNNKGSLVTSVIEGEPAAKAGVKTGDVITAVGDKPVEDSNQLLRHIAALKPGETAKLNILRKGQSQVLSVTLGQRDAKKLAQNEPTGQGESEDGQGDAASIIGLSVRAVTPQEAKALGMVEHLPLQKLYAKTASSHVFQLHIETESGQETKPALIWQLQYHPTKSTITHGKRGRKLFVPGHRSPHPHWPWTARHHRRPPPHRENHAAPDHRQLDQRQPPRCLPHRAAH